MSLCGALSLATEPVRGVDVSAYQPRVDWQQVAGAGYRFAYIKTSEGLTYTSPTLREQWDGAGRAGLLRGGYHFLHPLMSGLHQARRFAELIEGLGQGELPPAVDFEGYEGIRGAPVDRLVAGALECAYELERLTNTIPVLYTGRWFWQRVSRAESAHALFQFPLWQASYRPKPDPMPWPATRWGTHWTFWQRSGTGSVPGVKGNCDLNVFAGSLDDLRALASGGAT